MVFFDSTGDKTLHKSVGYEPPGPFQRQVLQARKEAGMPLTPEMQALQARVFVAEEPRMAALARQGDVAGLVKYLAPAARDVIRESNFLVANRGKVYTVRCVRRDCQAKIEITDVTLVPSAPGKWP